MTRPLKGRPSTWNRWVQSCHEAWRCATDAWEVRLEEAAVGYATEAREFRAAHPQPRYADFLVGMAQEKEQHDVSR